MNNMDEVLQAISIGLIVAYFLLNTNRVLKSIEICKECLAISKQKAGFKDDKLTKLLCKRVYLIMSKAYRAINDNTNAIKYARESGEKLEEDTLCFNLGNMYFHQSKYTEARELYEKSLAINKEIGDRNGEASCYLNLGAVYQSVGEYDKAREHLEKSLVIKKEIGDRNGEANCYVNLGNVYQLVGKYSKAKEHLDNSLVIKKEIGDRNGEATCYVNLGSVFLSVGEYDKAREHVEKSLVINKEIGDRNGEADCYVNLGKVYNLFGEYDKAREHFEKSLVIKKEIGERNGEADCYVHLGIVYQSVGEYDKAKEHLEKSLVIMKEIGDRNGEANCYVNLGALYTSVDEYDKARENLEKSLVINKEIGDRNGEAICYGNLGAVYRSVGEYDKAREHVEKSLVINKEIGDRNGEADCYTNLGNVYKSVGECDKAIEHFEKSLAIKRKYGDKPGVIRCCHNLGVLFLSLGKYPKANEYNKEALKIASEIGDRAGKAYSLLLQGDILSSLCRYVEAKEYCEKAKKESKEIGDRTLEARSYLILGQILFKDGENDTAEQHFNKSLAISKNIGDVSTHFESLEKLANVRSQEGNIQEATSYLLAAIEKCEKLRGSLRDNDRWKISFADTNSSSYRKLCKLLCHIGNPELALHVSELGKARALADLMSAQYAVKNQVSANPQTLAGIETIMDRERNCSCLYVSYSLDRIYFWILKRSQLTQFREIKGQELAYEGRFKNLDDFFATKSFRSFGMSTTELRKDESSNAMQGKSNSCKDDSHEGFQLGNESKENQGPKMNLPLCYKLIIAPVADLLDGSEIIIVPDRALYNIPFAALPDESGKTLSETFKIRVAPSLTTLRLIHDSPADYHSQTGALIVGNPDVGEVIFKGCLMSISRLPSAEEEAKMVGRKLGVEPLLGQQATKQAVLQAMESVALIHLAAHGDAERGSIALAPSFRRPDKIAREGHYLLTMSDIAQVKLRAKLVVLSCCHSARGEIKAEGAVGIARAFLGSGARSVLVSLWALDDEATKELMSQFYDHLVRGESASDSLHQAMKWMRCNYKPNGNSEVKHWAPFVLIGDNVTFDFGK